MIILKILIVGLGYVGLANLLLLSKREKVIGYDINKKKIHSLANGNFHFSEKDMDNMFKRNKERLEFENNFYSAVTDVETVIICVSTDSTSEGKLNTSSVSETIKAIKKYNSKALIIIRSTVPVGFTQKMNKEYNGEIVFMPEFLREGHTIHDSLFPSRLVIGGKLKASQKVLALFKKNTYKSSLPVVFCNSDEAEAIKLFSNAFLALRVAFFNEIDNFSMFKGLDTRAIIHGVTLDKRIGNDYCLPSFGYGGYCLPKDTKQIANQFPQKDGILIKAVSKSNLYRKSKIIEWIVNSTSINTDTIGIYRLSMKKGSNDYRNSAILDIINELKIIGYKIIIYEPTVKIASFNSINIVNNLKVFNKKATVILANRIDKKAMSNISPKKIFTRDLLK